MTTLRMTKSYTLADLRLHFYLRIKITFPLSKSEVVVLAVVMVVVMVVVVSAFDTQL